MDNTPGTQLMDVDGTFSGGNQGSIFECEPFGADDEDVVMGEPPIETLHVIGSDSESIS
jgi:hypothetical protein